MIVAEVRPHKLDNPLKETRQLQRSRDLATDLSDGLQLSCPLVFLAKQARLLNRQSRLSGHGRQYTPVAVTIGVAAKRLDRHRPDNRLTSNQRYKEGRTRRTLRHISRASRK